MLQRLLGDLDLEGVLIQADALHTQQAFFGSSGAGGRLSADGQVQPEEALPPDRRSAAWKAQDPFMATDHEVGHGRDITWALRAKEAPEHIKANWYGVSWIAEVIATGTRDGKPF